MNPESQPDSPGGAGVLADSDHELIVAYLDDELEVQQRRAVEERLSGDREFRHRLRELQRSWDLLDELPTEKADEAFTQTTVEMVVVSAQDELAEARRRNRWRTWLAGLACGGLVVGALAAGYYVTRTAAEPDNEQLLRDYEVIRDVRQLEKIDDVEFLRQVDSVLPASQPAPSGGGNQADDPALPTGDPRRSPR